MVVGRHISCLWRFHSLADHGRRKARRTPGRPKPLDQYLRLCYLGILPSLSLRLHGLSSALDESLPDQRPAAWLVNRADGGSTPGPVIEASEGGYAATILGGVLGAAALLNQWRKSNANTARQIQNDENATDWQSSLLAQNKEKDDRIAELQKRQEDHWMLLSEARFDISKANNEAQLWKLKYEQLVEARTNEPAKVNEHVAVLTSALQSANEENERLRAKLKG